MPSRADELLAEARRHLQRLTPRAASDALAAGALLVDIRPIHQRRRDGEVAGSVVVGRNVLEWRLDRGGDLRIPEADRHDSVIVICAQGFASSFAARSLQALGWRDATDVIGGFDAWAAEGLPVRPCAGPTTDESSSNGEKAFDQTG